METKNQQNNFNNPIVIVLVLALIGLGGYVLFSKNSSNNQTLTTASTQTETQTSAQSLQGNCDTTAKKYFENYIEEEDKGIPPDKKIIVEKRTLGRSYKSNLSDVRGRCYVEIIEKSGDISEQFLMKTIFDVDGNPNVYGNLKDTYIASLGVSSYASGATNLVTCVTDEEDYTYKLSLGQLDGKTLKCNSPEEFDSKIFEMYGIK